MRLTHGSLFTGVGGFDLGLERAGIKTLWQVELEPSARDILEHTWPDVARYEDIANINGAEIDPVHVISFGSPCQDLSSGGKRAGLSGSRSILFYQAIRIIQEMQEATNGKYPQLAIWENVPGALSSKKGKDFRAAINALREVGSLDIAWRVLNTAHYGPPQRRLRLYTIADFRGERAGQILSQPARVLWNLEQTAQKESRDTRGAETSPRGGDTASNESVWVKAKRAITSDDYESWEKNRPAPTLNGFENHNDARATVLAVKHRIDGLNQSIHDGALYNTLRTDDDSGDCIALDGDTYQIRRLTPVECERLQGLPDGHTRYGASGKEYGDWRRYKLIGNAVSAPVAQWLGEEIQRAWRHKG